MSTKNEKEITLIKTYRLPIDTIISLEQLKNEISNETGIVFSFGKILAALIKTVHDGSFKKLVKNISSSIDKN